MIVLNSLEDAGSARAGWKRPVVTPGFFDGMHLGHQKLLAELRGWADQLGGEPVALTFEQHPRMVVSGSSPPTVHSLRQRLRSLERENVAAVLVLPFDAEMSRWTPEEFIRRVMVEALGSHHLLLGFDSAIGHRRRGTYEYLSSRSASLGIEVRHAEACILDGEKVSSTRLREAVSAGQLEAFVHLTGRPYSLLGRVVTGDRRGRELGFPTANLEIESEAVPPHGVYFVEVSHAGLPDGRTPGVALDACPGLLNIGRRPTFVETRASTAANRVYDPERDRIEVHVLDFDGDLYGSWLEVSLLRYHRPERRFEGVEALVDQIRRDESTLREWLVSHRV